VPATPSTPSAFTGAFAETFGVFRSRFWAIVPLFLVLGLPFEGLSRSAGMAGASFVAQQSLSALGAIVLYLAQAAAAVLTARAMAGEPASAWDAFRKGLRRWVYVLPAFLVWGNRVSVGLVLGLVPGILWFVQGRFLLQVAVLRDGLHPFDHSRAVVRGNVWVLAGLSLLAAASTAALPSGVEAGVDWLVASGVLKDGMLLKVLGDSLADVLTAFWCVLDTVLFLRLEARNGLAPAEVIAGAA
jgi:hypothetical protein